MIASGNNHCPPPVMILGCGRSGTSIFGELFNYLGDYTYKSEPPFADVVDADYAVPQAFKVPHESPGHVPDTGLSFPLATLLNTAPNMKLFWIVRHPLDAVSSLRVGISQDWGHHPRPPDWRDWLDKPLVEQCAYHWSFVNSLGFSNVSSTAKVVHFEAMICDPQAFARAICRILNIENDIQDNRLDEWARRVQNENNVDFVEAETSQYYSRPDHSVRIGRWRENLTDSDVARIIPIVSEAAEAFGYEL